MSKYMLNIHFSETALKVLAKAHQKCVLVKKTAGDKDTSVSWVAFKPWAKNTITWQEDFAVYASDSEIQGGANIAKLSDKMAASGVLYKLADGAIQAMGPGSDLPDNAYSIRNCEDECEGITVGLAQSVSVNGRAYANNPINAVYVPLGQNVIMQPLESVSIYMENDVRDGMVITKLKSDALTITYDEETEHTISYNPQTGQFYFEN